MLRHSFFIVLGAVVALSSISPAMASEPAAAIPVADFFRRPVFSNAVLSPSGRYVAASMKGGPNGRHGLVMIDVKDQSKSKGLAAFADADVATVQWVNEDRLVFTLVDLQAPVADQIGGGLYTVDREGKLTAKSLIRRRLAQSERYGVHAAGSRLGETGLSVFHSLRSVIRDGSNDVVILRADVNDRFEATGSTLLRLDVVTNETKVISRSGPDYVHDWATDIRGNPRAAVSHHEGKSRLYWRATTDAPWVQVADWPTYAGMRKTINPLFADATNRLYVSSRLSDGDDFEMLSRLDMSTTSLDWKPLLSLDGYDFDGGIEMRDDGVVAAVHYLTDARGTHWFDPAMKAVQAKVDALLPGTINRIDCGGCINPHTVLIVSSADRQPKVFYLFDVASGKISLLSQSRPWIKAQTMAHREMKRVIARDGLSIPVHVTRPAGAKGPQPAVVLVHGGPYVRGGEWEWDADSQFLASRGYVVIEPEFRGSTGFGFKHFKAGWKQWGLAMQDDVADATQWAIKQGLVDPQRICIAGATQR